MKHNSLVSFPTSPPSPKSLLFLNQGRARLRGDKPEAKSAAFLAAHDKLVAVSRNCIFEDTLIYYRGREKLSNFFLRLIARPILARKLHGRCTFSTAANQDACVSYEHGGSSAKAGAGVRLGRCARRRPRLGPELRGTTPRPRLSGGVHVDPPGEAKVGERRSAGLWVPSMHACIRAHTALIRISL